MPTENDPELFGRGLDPELEKHFAPLCTSVDPREFDELRTAVGDHVAWIRTELQNNEFLDIKTAENIAQALIVILDDFNEYPEPRQKLIVGAARYFVSPLDADPDTSSLLGLDDDVAVLNYVLESIGKPQLKVEL